MRLFLLFSFLYKVQLHLVARLVLEQMPMCCELISMLHFLSYYFPIKYLDYYSYAMVQYT